MISNDPFISEQQHQTIQMFDVVQARILRDFSRTQPVSGCLVVMLGKQNAIYLIGSVPDEVLFRAATDVIAFTHADYIPYEQLGKEVSDLTKINAKLEKEILQGQGPFLKKIKKAKRIKSARRIKTSRKRT